MSLKPSRRRSVPVVLTVLWALAALLLSAPVSDASPAAALDGKTFVGKSGEQGKPASGEDQITFRDGKFSSSACKEWGFGDAPYTADVDGNAVRFQAVTHSEEHGKIEWKGKIEEDRMEAVYVWWAKGKEKQPGLEKWFRGNLSD